MRAIRNAMLALCAAILAACGGGGGTGAKVDLVGRVLNVETGGAANPAAAVQAGGGSAATSLVDGSFALKVSSGTSSITVDTLTSFGVFVFNVPPITSTTDVGDLWVGPEKVKVSGTVRDATTNSPVPGAIVSFAGRTATTDAGGIYNLKDVAYSSANPAGFWGIVGSVRATNYFLANFSAAEQTATSGIVVLDDILLTPSADPNPPPPPYSIYGRISPSAEAPGTIVTLESSGTPIRKFNVGADGYYYFWVGKGTYTVKYQKGALTAPPQTVDLPTGAEVVRRDVTLG